MMILKQAGMLLLVATAGRAQSIRGAVPAKREPHHHLAYEDATLRVLRVRVPAHDTTLLHEHDADYFWIALGPSTVVNAKLGTPDATITSADLSMHYTPGKFAHVARNPGGKPFDNITIELLEPQKDVHNLCEAALADKPLECAPSAGALFVGAEVHPAFRTASSRVSLLTIPPGAALRPLSGSLDTWIIALDTADARRSLVAQGMSGRGGTFRSSRGTLWSMKNRGRSPVRVIAFVKQTK